MARETATTSYYLGENNMKKFFGKIIALFSGEEAGGVVEEQEQNSDLDFFDFKPDPYAIRCNCKKYTQQEILVA